MPKVNSQKSIKNKRFDDISIQGIVGVNYTFHIVSEKAFYSGLAHLGLNDPVYVDSRLLKSHKLEIFNLSNGDLDDLRDYGVDTKLIRYIHYNQHYLHNTALNEIECILHCIEEYNLETIKYPITLIPFIQDLKVIKQYWSKDAK